MDKTKLIELLNHDLEGELQAIIQYSQHAFLVGGVSRPQLHDILENIAKDEMKHMEMLAERIVAMGGTPSTRPRPALGGNTIEEMLSNNLKIENEALKDYATRIKQAEEAGEMGTALILEDILVDEQNHADEFFMLLKKQQ